MAEQSPYLCPCCRRPLYVGRAQNVVLHACGACRGVWLDANDALKALRGWISEKALELLVRVDGGAAAEAHGYRDSASAAHGMRACPHCGRELQRTQAQGGLERLELDTCRQHGMWFDRTELTRIAKTAIEARDATGSPQGAALQRVAIFSALEHEIERLEDRGDPDLAAAAKRMQELVDRLRLLLMG